MEHPQGFQKIKYDLIQISRESNPRRSIDLESTRKRKHIKEPNEPIGQDHDRDSDNDNDSRPVAYVDISDDEIDHYGNIKNLIDYEGEPPRKVSRLNYGDSDSDDSDYTIGAEEGTDIFEQEYQKYLKTLSVDDQTLLSSLETEIKEFTQNNHKPLKYRILMMKAPIKVKSLAMTKLHNLTQLEKTSADYGYEWATLNYLLNLPWDTYVALPVSKDADRGQIHAFLQQSAQFLETITYGQFGAKSTLLLELGSYLENPDGKGFILGLKGAPGSGKTTLIDQGLAKLLHRPFFRIDLGGAKHSDSLFGTRKVFERSDLGDLTKALIEGQCLNPIFLFDELDKVSMSEYGLEIIHALNDLTDRSRNHALLDQYLGVHLDFSRAIFVFTYNDHTKIPDTLRNRIHEIEIQPYSLDDKIHMTHQFFLPKRGCQLGFDTQQIHFDNPALRWLITHHTQGEKGARQLETQIKKIIQKINWMRLTSGHTQLHNYHGHGLTNLQFPLKITLKIIKQVMGESQVVSKVPRSNI